MSPKVDMALDGLLRLVVHGIREGRIEPALALLDDIIAQIPDHPMKAELAQKDATIAALEENINIRNKREWGRVETNNALREALKWEHEKNCAPFICSGVGCQVCALLAPAPRGT